jgi:hypothetical protein
MKSLFISFSLMLIGFASFAQSEQYTNAMKGFMSKMGSATSPDAYQVVGNGFERIASAEKGEWLPRYYAAFSYIMQGMMTEDKSKVDGIIDMAEKNIADAQVISQSEELLCLAAWCKSARIGVDPMSRGMKYGTEAAQLLEAAKKINPNNPRIYFLQGQSAFYTPEAFGGGKAKAKEIFQKSVELFETFKPTSEMMPNWGVEQAKKMLEECSK